MADPDPTARADFRAFCHARAKAAGLTLAAEQKAAIEIIALLAQKQAAGKKRGLAKIFAAPARDGKGFFLWGPPGGGKTMLLDFFFTYSSGTKMRMHFIDFMESVHRRIRRLRQSGGGDPVPQAAREIARQARLLCCDEFQLEDIADASILSRFFDAFWQAGGLLAATGNRAPERLYAGGLQRARFVPFLDLLARHCRVIALQPEWDYRQKKLGEAGFYHCGAGAKEKMDALFATLTAAHTAAPAIAGLPGGRHLKIKQAAGETARLDFADLCAAPLGAQDYLALARQYRTIFLDALPCLAPEDRNEAKRFMLLVDVLYDRRVNLVLGAARPAAAIYPEGDGAAAFARTVSRLAEMGQAGWAEKRAEL